MIEAPISGTSLNPARSLAPAALMGMLDHFCLCFVGPIVGAVLAVGVFRGIGGEKTATGCAKFHYTHQYPCLFEGCGYDFIARGRRVRSCVSDLPR